MAKYETKLNVGQMAWFMMGNKVVCLPVGAVTIKEELLASL